MKALVVDDNDLVRNATARFLKSRGYEVDAFAEPTSATERFASDPSAFAFAILDVNLGTSDGVALARTLRAIAPSLRVVFMTGSDESAERAARDAPVIRKPWSSAEMLAVLEGWTSSCTEEGT